MSSTASATLTKGEFATHIGVSPGRVSQMIAEGKIGPDALHGYGRTARIIVDRATAQIAARRDMGQALGNGANTRLDLASLPPAPAQIEAQVTSLPRSSGADEAYKAEKLNAIRMANRKAAEDEEARRGRFMETSEARSQMTRLAGGLLQTFEGGLADLATAVAERFAVPQRDVLHLLRTEFRQVRESAAKRFSELAAAEDQTVESVVATDDTP